MNIIRTILEMTVYSSIMIFVVIAIKSLMNGKINLKIIAFLWALVLIRLLVPITIPSPIHLDSFMKSKSPTNTNALDEAITNDDGLTEPIIYNQPTATYEETNDSLNNEFNNTTTAPIATSEQTLIENAINNIKEVSVWVYLIFAWAMGVLFLIINNMIAYFMFSNHIKHTKVSSSRVINREIRKLRSILSIKTDVKVVISKYVDSPLTFRLINPIIVLPEHFTNMISPEKLNMILLHELCHIKRKDIFYNILWLIAKTIHWFNPFVWIAYNSYVEDIELACDEMVTKYLTEEQGYVYSQSLIDVIRFTKSMAKLPIALSFCEDKCKLRKRVENMLKPKQKLKSASIISILAAMILIFTCFTTSCQPAQADETATATSTTTIEPTEVTEVNIVEEIDGTSEPTTHEPTIVTYNSTSTSGLVHVNIDAEVINNQPENIPYAAIAPYTFSINEIEQMVQAFYGNTQLYDRSYTKDDYEFIIQKRLQDMENPEMVQLYADDRDITDLSVAKEKMQEAVDRWITEQEETPEQRPYLEDGFLGINDEHGINALIDTGSGYMGSVGACNWGILLTAFNDNNIYYKPRSSYHDISSWVDPNTDDSELQNAKSMAIQMISDMGINGVQLGDIYLKMDSTSSFDDTSESYNGREFYVFKFERIVGNSSLDNTLCSGQLSYYKDPVDTGVEYTGPSDDYLRSYEILELWVEGDTFVQFRYKYPMQVTQLLNDNAEIIDYNQAVELASQHAYSWYEYIYSGFDEININIDEIELILARTVDRNTGEYIVVPAWNFSGELQGKLNENGAFNRPEDEGNWETRNGNWGGDRTLITVNALDGSIIDMEHGY